MALKQTEPDVVTSLFTSHGVHPDRLEASEVLLAELERERARLAATLDSLMDPHVIFEAVRDDSGRVIDFIFTDANDAAIEYNHSTREEMIGASLLDILPGHESSGTFEIYVHALETGEPLILDDSVYFNEAWNSERRCDVRALKVGDGLSYTWRDVTDRAQSLEKYRLLAENASDIVLEVNRDGVIRWISPSSQILDWRPEDLLGRSIFDIVLEEDHGVIVERRRQVLAGEATTSVEGRFLSAHGDLHWMSVSAKPIRDLDGSIAAVVVGLRDIDGEVETRESLAKSEAHFRLLAENSSDIVYETDLEGVITWVSPSVQEVLGWAPDALLGTRAVDLVANEDGSELSQRHQQILSGQKVGRAQFRLRTAGGDLRWMNVRAQPARGATSNIVGSVVALRDSHGEVAAQRAANTLSAGSQVLVRSESEEGLLVEMCQAAVDEGGYALAWYARRVDDEARSIVKVVASSGHRDYVDAIKVDWGSGPLGSGPVGTAIRTEEPVVMSNLAGNENFAPWLGQAMVHGFQSCIALPVRVESEIDGSLQVYSIDANAFDGHVVEVLKDLAGELGFGIKRLRDHERLVQSLKDQALLSKAIDQASESILITDPAGAMLYANPSSVRTSGYSLEELLGENPRILQSELHDSTFFQVMWARLLGGKPWHGTMINRRKGGELYEEDATISPIHDPEGRLMAYVAVKRDLTVERRLETNRTREQRDRLDILDIMQDVRRGESLQNTAEAFCRAAANLVDIDAALMVLVQGDGTLLTIGTGGEELAGATSGVTLEFQNPELLIERTEAGSWWIDLSQYRVVSSDGVTARMIRGGFTAIGNVPIRWEGQLVGILALATKAKEGPESMSARLAVFEELGSYAGALFGAEVDVFSKRESLRSSILDIMKNRSFHPVFQPFVELEGGKIVGYEALTRFDDGESPDQRFVQAHSIGLGSELEALCARTALDAASELEPDIWLSLNFSPAALLDGHAAGVVNGVTRHIVIEVTEHAQIKNYTAIRRALSEIPNCQLAVDDAGAGYTSLSHILELQPDFVKLDISLVRDIDTNPARQAMIAGMCHFAAQSGTTLIAEGIETDAEARKLRELGVPLGEAGMLGQGYLFGRPKMLTQSQ
ncbi:MAG: PAS domain S-box protein [Acidimicrobiales bacterium]